MDLINDGWEHPLNCCMSFSRIWQGKSKTYEMVTEWARISFSGKQPSEEWQEEVGSSWQIISNFTNLFVLGKKRKIDLCSHLFKLYKKEPWWLNSFSSLPAQKNPYSIFLHISIPHSNFTTFFFQAIPPCHLCLFPFPQSPHPSPAMYLAELAAAWPKSPSTGTTLEGVGPLDELSPHPVRVFVCLRVFLFACVHAAACGWPHARIRAGLKHIIRALVSTVWI